MEVILLSKNLAQFHNNLSMRSGMFNILLQFFMHT